MYISPLEYIELTDRIELLKKQCSNSHQENVKLKETLSKQQQQINYLENKIQQQSTQQQTNHQQVIEHVTNTSQNVKDFIGMTTEEQRVFIEQQVEKIKADVNVKKLKQLEKKMTENRMKHHEMVDFYQKVKTLYHSWTKKKKQPTTTELYKWVSDRKIDAAENMSNASFMTGDNSFMSIMKGSKFGKNLSGVSKNTENILGRSKKSKKSNKENEVPNRQKIAKKQKERKVSSFLPIVEENEKQNSHCDFSSEILSKGSLLEEVKNTLKEVYSGEINQIKIEEAENEMAQEVPKIIQNQDINILDL